MWQNFMHLSAAALSASSTMSGRSVNWLKRQLRTKTWRSAAGWSVAAGFNDVLRFDEGTDQRMAWLDPVNYNGLTGAQVATQLTADMGAAGLDPLDLAPSAWYRADALNLADGADVSAWSDVSGNARHLDTSVGTQTFHKAAINGRPAVRFAEDGRIHAASSAVQWDDVLGASGQGTMFVVAWVDSDHAGWDALCAAPNSTRGAYVDSNQDSASIAWDGAQDVATLAGTYSGGWHLFSWAYDTTNVKNYADDLDTAAEASTASGTQTDLAQDVCIGGDLAANFLKGYVAEVIIYPTALTEENRRRVAYYLAQKYDLDDVTTNTTAPTWANTYSAAYSATAYKYTLQRATGAATLGLPWTDTAWVDRTCGLDLGFDVSADDTGSTAYVGDNAAYQSRHYLELDQGAANGIRATAILNHNFDSSAVLTLQGSDEPFWEGTPDYEATLDWHTDNVVKFFANQAKRYWRLTIDDVQNAAGYGEVGIWFVGDYFEPNKAYRPGFKVKREELSGVGFADHGAAFMDDKPTMKGWGLSFQPVLEADKDSFETIFDYVKTSRHWLLCFDSAGGDEEGETRYGYLASGASVRHLANSLALYGVDFDFMEAVQ
jgi:hypothetical protein